jgi:hypothetical protein
MISVVNKYKHTPTKFDCYIGRGSPLGNPYSHLPSGKAQFRVESREEAIEKYEQWLNNAYCNEASVHIGIDRLVERELAGETTNLVCYCAPCACHGMSSRDL